MKNEIKINTFLIGAQKAGTSSLYDWLSQHPEIYAPIETKDYHYFHLNEISQDNQYPFNKYYKELSNEKIVMKGAVNYVYVPEVAKKIYDYNPEAKLIIVLRDPVKRAISAYNYFYKLGQEVNEWNVAVKTEIDGKLLGVVEKSNFSYLEHGYYYDQYLNITQYFDASKVLLLFYEDMVSDKEEFLNRVYSFLKVENTFTPMYNHVNKTGSARFLWINRFFFGNSFLSKTIRPIVKKMTSKKWRILFGIWIRESNMKSSQRKKEMEYNIPIEVLEKYKMQSDAIGKVCQRDLSKIWQF